jgi:hypothetical protein
MLKKIFILPPLSISRVGGSEEPCDSFSWSASQISPGAPATLTIKIENSFKISESGDIGQNKSGKINFKDSENKFHPVCPFFELWGEWELEGEIVERPITVKVLHENGLSLSNIEWTIVLANLKAYHFTLADGDRIKASANFNAEDSTSKSLFGFSPSGAGIAPLVLPDHGLYMGAVQAVRPRDENDKIRIRFTPPSGLVYGPKNIKERIDKNSDVVYRNPDESLDADNSDWIGFDLPEAQKIINPDARWATLNFDINGPAPIGAGDPRNDPGQLSARLYERRGTPDNPVVSPISMGLVDDVSDGLVQCRLSGLKADARIVVGPPDMAPANRPIISLQDGLSDRSIREDARRGIISDIELEEIIADIFERALETSELMNKDAQNDRARLTNLNTRRSDSDLNSPGNDFEPKPRNTLWETISPQSTANPASTIPFNGDAMPVSDRGRRKHRRYNALEYLRDRLREEPDLLEKWMRVPRDESEYFDRRMPALMRGSDGMPIHFTRRQYELLRLWAKRQGG